MKSLLAASIAFFLCTPVLRTMALMPKSEDGEYHFNASTWMTPYPTQGNQLLTASSPLIIKLYLLPGLIEILGVTKDSADTKDNFSIALDELLSYGLASQSTSSNFNNINAAGVGR